MAKDTNIVKWQGRKTKLTKELVSVMNELATDPTTALLTDEEIVISINDKLKPADRISYSVFRQWKEKRELAESIDGETLEAFLSAIKSIRIHQKRLHASEMLDNEKAGTWQRRAWILERKFPDLNLTTKVESTVTHKGADIEILPPSSLNIEEAEYEDISNQD